MKTVRLSIFFDGIHAKEFDRFFGKKIVSFESKLFEQCEHDLLGVR